MIILQEPASTVQEVNSRKSKQYLKCILQKGTFYMHRSYQVAEVYGPLIVWQKVGWALCWYESGHLEKGAMIGGGYWRRKPYESNIDLL